MGKPYLDAEPVLKSQYHVGKKNILFEISPSILEVV